MSEKTQMLTFSAITTDPFDAAIRILCDAQRFGFELTEFHLQPAVGRSSTMTFELRVPAGTNTGLIASRFARHAAVTSLKQAEEV